MVVWDFLHQQYQLHSVQLRCWCFGRSNNLVFAKELVVQHFFFFKWHHLTQKFLVIQKFPMEKLEAEHHSVDQKRKTSSFQTFITLFSWCFFWGGCWTVELVELYWIFQQLNFNQKKTDTTSGGATMLWCCDFDVFFFLLARALLWLLPVQSQHSWLRWSHGGILNRVRGWQCKVRRKSQGGIFFGVGPEWTPGWEAHDKKEQISKKSTWF